MKILTVSDNPNMFSGLAKVHRNVIDGLLSAGHEVVPAVWFAYDTKTMAMIQHGYKPPRPTYKGIEMLPLAKNENAPLSAHDICKIIKPDVVLTIGDYWSFYYMHAVKNKLNYQFKWVAYLTVEEEEIDKKKWQPLFRYMDDVAVPTEFGMSSLASIGVNAHLIPYGVDEVFRRLPDDKRAQLRKDRGITEGVTRFITVAQNTIRKSLPSILLTAQELKKRGRYSPDCLDNKFYIHTNVGASDSSETYVYDLIGLAKKLDVEDMVSFPPLETSLFGPTGQLGGVLPTNTGEELLRDEYNASDFYLSTSLSEGYGLPVMEAMACGVPCLANGTSTLYEMVGVPYGKTGYGERGGIFKSRVEVLPPAKLANIVDPKLLADEIESLRKREMKGNCEDYARRSNWEGMGKKLVEVIAQMEKRTVIPVEEI